MPRVVSPVSRQHAAPPRPLASRGGPIPLPDVPEPTAHAPPRPAPGAPLLCLLPDPRAPGCRAREKRRPHELSAFSPQRPGGGPATAWDWEGEREPTALVPPPPPAPRPSRSRHASSRHIRLADAPAVRVRCRLPRPGAPHHPHVWWPCWLAPWRGPSSSCGRRGRPRASH
jgi:hypothetical protein